VKLLPGDLEEMTLQQANILPQSNPPEAVHILGVRVDRVTQQQVLASIDQVLLQHRASAGSLPCQQVVTLNPEFVMAAQRWPDFRAAINSAALVIADGTGVVWATRYLGKPVPQRLTGTDLLPLLAGRCAAAGYRLYLLGAAPGVAEIAARRLQELAPGLQIAGTFAGSPAAVEEDEIIQRVSEARADVLCVAYGAPAQELWIWRNCSRLPVALAIGVGGAFDFLSGRKQRAPRSMQRIGLEWMYRLYREPWRWRRMLAIPRFILQVIVRGRARHDA
jgi:N-acetylglucosaminyldiphosphoundecaprenol N-acetyl-beta-D-mannosaminyltransferase